MKKRAPKTAASEPPETHDVIIIGGGIAGLTAALHLAKRRRKVLLLEARERLGGRIHNIDTGERTEVALGPEFVHGGNALLRYWLRKARVRLGKIDHTMWVKVDDEFVPDSSYWDGIGEMASALPSREGITVARFLATHPDFAAGDRRKLQDYLESFNAAPASRLSASAVKPDRGGTETAQLRPQPGYGVLLEKLRRELDKQGVKVCLRSPVTRVQWQRGQVRVSTPTRIHHATTALITLPLGVLRKGTVAFQPPLIQKDALAQRMGWGQVARVTLEFDRHFWASTVVPAGLCLRGRPRFGFLTSPGSPFPVWWVPDPGLPRLVAWAGGPASTVHLGKNPRAWAPKALGSLARAWGVPVGSLRKHLKQAWAHDWSADPHALGAYSYVAAGCEQGPRELAKPLRGTLFFAGEATADEVGTVHGAMESGARAAGEILALPRAKT